MRELICAPLDCLRKLLTDIRSIRCAARGPGRTLLLVLLALVFAPGLAFGALPPELPNPSGIRPLNSSAQQLSLAVSLPTTGASGILMQSGRPYIPAGAGGSLAIGEPDVPVFGEWVLIPNGAQVSMQIHPGEPIIFDNVDIPPVQPPKLNSAEAAIPQFTVNTVTYSLNQDCPGVFAEIGQLRNVR